MAKKKKQESIQQTAVKRVLDVLHSNKAYSEKTAVGYKAFNKVNYPTQVVAYTIANLMENGVVRRTEDERFYFVEEEWKKLKRKVNIGNLILIGLPIFIFLVFLAIKFIF